VRGFYCLEHWGTPKLTDEQNILSMSRRTIDIAAALSLLALGSPLITGCSNHAGIIHFRSAELKHDRGNYQGAIDDYTKVIAMAYGNRGVAKVKLGDTQGAISDYNKAIEINPQNAAHYYNRGSAKKKIGDLKGACADWEEEASLLGIENAASGEMYQC